MYFDQKKKQELPENYCVLQERKERKCVGVLIFVVPRGAAV